MRTVPPGQSPGQRVTAVSLEQLRMQAELDLPSDLPELDDPLLAQFWVDTNSLNLTPSQSIHNFGSQADHSSLVRFYHQRIDIVKPTGVGSQTTISCLTPLQSGIYKLIDIQNPKSQTITFESGGMFNAFEYFLQKQDDQSTLTVYTDTMLSADCIYSVAPAAAMATDVFGSQNLSDLTVPIQNYDGASTVSNGDNNRQANFEATASSSSGSLPPPSLIVQEPRSKVKAKLFKNELPLMTLEALRWLENLLSSDPAFKRDLASLLMIIGGANLKKRLHRILNVLLSLDLQSQLNFKGQGDKMAFGQFEGLLAVIFAAVGNPSLEWDEYILGQWCGTFLKQAPNKKKGVSRPAKGGKASSGETKVKVHGSNGKFIVGSSLTVPGTY